MEYIGHAEAADYDRVLFRGNVPNREFIAFWLRDNRILAGMAVNTWDVIDPLKILIRTATPIDPDHLGDPNQPLDGRA